ncbi:unnamed protein product, partial [marine sediment metagenome]
MEVNLGRNGKIILGPDDVNLKRFPLINELNKAKSEKKPILKIRDLHDFDG